MSSTRYFLLMSFSLLAVGWPVTARAQCTADRLNQSAVATNSVWTTDNTCSVPDGGYVKTGTEYKLHVKNQVTGTCDVRGTAKCVVLTTYLRYADWTQHFVNSSYIPGNTNNTSNFVQSYDTCAAPPCTSANTGGTGREYETPATPGTVTYTTTNQASGGTVGSGPQYCNMGLEYQGINPITLNVLTCEPRFWDQAGDPPVEVPILHLIPGDEPISIFLDPVTLSGAATALDDAIDDWNSRVGSSGIEFERVSTSCGNGPACITVQSVAMGTCGFASAAFNSMTGNMTGNILLKIKDDWATFNTPSLTRTFAHELGHLLGMHNAVGSCGGSGDVNDAVMNDQFQCGPSVTDEITATTMNDYQPVNNTVFGGKPKTSCGF